MAACFANLGTRRVVGAYGTYLHEPHPIQPVELYGCTVIDRATILSAIRERSEANGGVPLGRTRFEKLTGIRQSDWLGRYWARWSDALREAGYEPNKMQRALDDETILSALVPVVRELDRLPTDAELKLRRRSDRLFPSRGVFERLGWKRELAAWLLEHSRKDPARRHRDDLRGSTARMSVRAGRGC